MAIIEITHLTKKYQNKIILNDINLTINQGDRIAIVGPNGNGKTTLCEIIAGLRPYSSGELHYVNPKLIIGMQLQEAKFSKGITGWDLCRFYLKYYNRAYSIEQLEYIFITLNVSGFINKPLNNLSGGQQQRINILLALIHQPELVILDELATGLDLESRTQIYQFVASQLNPHNTLLLVTHTMNEVEMFCTDLLFLYQGRITQRASVKDIIEKYQSVENYVKLKFSEYKLNQEREGMLLKLQGDRKNEQWKKEWQKDIKN